MSLLIQTACLGCPLQVEDGTPVEERGGFTDGGTATFSGDWSRGAAILNTGAYDFAGSGVVHMTVRRLTA